MTSRANMASTTAAATVAKLSGHKGLNDLVVRKVPEPLCVCVSVRRQYRPHVVKLWQAAALYAAFQLPWGHGGRIAPHVMASAISMRFSHIYFAIFSV